MAVERKFINSAVKKAKVDSFLRNELDSVGCGDIEIKRTPLGTRIVIHARKPGLVIGRKGETIQKLTQDLKDKYGVENPQLEVKEVPSPNLNPAVMAKQLASSLETGIHFRRASYRMIKQIMDSGALGVQIEISGKISGSRARNEKFKSGYLKHCGETSERYVKESVAEAKLKQGVLGVKVKLVPPLKEGTMHELAFGVPEIKAELKDKMSEADEINASKQKSSEPKEKEDESKSCSKSEKESKKDKKKKQEGKKEERSESKKSDEEKDKKQDKKKEEQKKELKQKEKTKEKKASGKEKKDKQESKEKTKKSKEEKK